MTPQEHTEPTRADQPGDDFRKIAGIGAALDRHLHDAGILTYHDLAARSPEQIAACLADVAYLSSARIASQDWPGQARQLAGPAVSLPSEPDQHYASFHIELLLDVDNSVRRTKVHHHQSEADFAWPGWDEERLLTLLRRHIPLTAAWPPAAPVNGRSPGQPTTSRGETAVASTSNAKTDSRPVSMVPSSLRIEEFIPVREGRRNVIWAPDEPASVRLALCVNRTRTVHSAAFDFMAEITAHGKLGNSQRRPLGTTQGAIRVGEPVSVELTGPPLPCGFYRLEAALSIYPTDHTSDAKPLHSRRVLGELIQVADAPPEPAASR
jgi:hypothetical protein